MKSLFGNHGDCSVEDPLVFVAAAAAIDCRPGHSSPLFRCALTFQLADLPGLRHFAGELCTLLGSEKRRKVLWIDHFGHAGLILLSVIKERGMRKVLLGHVVLFALMLATVALPSRAADQPAPPDPKIKVGDVAPDFSLPDQTGKEVKLSDFRGKKNVVLAFYVFAFTGG
jgi:hypothetical protein